MCEFSDYLKARAKARIESAQSMNGCECEGAYFYELKAHTSEAGDRLGQ
jgi:hypothetical protein